MAEATADAAEAPAKRSRTPLLIGLVLALLAGGGGFYAVSSGLILGEGGHGDEAAAHDEAAPGPLPDVAFVPIEPLVINIGEGGRAHFLRFRAQLEVPSANAAEVTAMLPRVVDVLNGYLRAVDLATLEDPAALHRLRAQMLRRTQIVTGEGRVRDFLIMEFVLN